MNAPQCLGHTNEFQHLDAELGELATVFDLGSRFEERESNQFRIDPNTGVKAWAERYLALYISVVFIAAPWETRTLSYGLTRSKWGQRLLSGEADRQRLLDLAKPRIQRDLQALLRGESPDTLSEPVML